jgi:transcriptional/translational regulatory protein YebC/TACO1
MRYIFSRNNGNLGEAGCVGWMFTAKGLITIDAEEVRKTEDELFEIAIEAGAEDLISMSSSRIKFTKSAFTVISAMRAISQHK